MAHGFPARLLALLAIACALLSALGAGPAGAAPGDPLRPFPQHQAYAPGSIRPSLVAQADQDAAVAAIYSQWKAGFLRPGCTPGRYYFWHGGRGGAGPGTVGTSEGQGYGMLIAAHMAGLDPDAHAIFDGLYAHFRDHPSLTSPDLMAWRQLDGCVDSPDAYSATDGDLDIAYALLLADRQWGSRGAINYLAEAGQLAAAIQAKEINPQTALTQLGDWVSVSAPTTWFATRTSDWMPDHFKAFQAATGNLAWLTTAEATYRALGSLQAAFAPATGLLPDFVVGTQLSPRPAGQAFLGEQNPGRYGWNACRVPWRLAADFLLDGDPRAKAAVGRIEDWFLAKTRGHPARVHAVYTLAGKPVEPYGDLAFTAPLAVGAMVDPKYQAWLNALWSATVSASFDPVDYYGNTLRLLATLVVSGNWWKP